MPTSVSEGKDWLLPRILAELPGVVLDVGAGEGTYAKLLGRRQGLVTHALEVHEPYVAEYGLEGLYDHVIVGDVRTVPLPAADVVILGDVIEHLELADAVAVWERCRRAARRAVFASIPLGDHPQGAVNGNEHERHRHTWSNDTIHAELPGIVASWTGEVIGTYAALPLNDATDTV